MLILVIGTPGEGFVYVGPFATNAEAEVYGEKYFAEHAWWICPLEETIKES
jgi:hypothetical protein